MHLELYRYRYRRVLWKSSKYRRKPKLTKDKLRHWCDWKQNFISFKNNETFEVLIKKIKFWSWTSPWRFFDVVNHFISCIINTHTAIIHRLFIFYLNSDKNLDDHIIKKGHPQFNTSVPHKKATHFQPPTSLSSTLKTQQFHPLSSTQKTPSDYEHADVQEKMHKQVLR